LEIDNPHLLLAEEMPMQLSEYAVIAGWAVDFMPWLKYLPRWFLGLVSRNERNIIEAKYRL
jgi:hypothetical protein